MYAKGNPVTPAAVKALAIFKFTRHPKMALHMDAMFSKIDKYNALCGEIPEREERMKKKPRCDKIVDSFDIHAWWKANMAELPHFSYVLRGVLWSAVPLHQLVPSGTGVLHSERQLWG